MKRIFVYIALFFLPLYSVTHADYEFEIKGESLDFSDKAENMGILAQGKGDKPCKIDIVFADFKNLAQMAKSKPLNISLSIMGGLKSGTYPFFQSKSTSMGSKWFAKNTGQVLITWQDGKNSKSKQYGGLDGSLTIKRDDKKVEGVVEGQMAEYKVDPYGELKVVSTVDVKAKFNHELATSFKTGGIGNMYLCKDK